MGWRCFFTCFVVFCAFVFFPAKHIQASVTNDAYQYWVHYHEGVLGQEEDSCKCGKQIGEAIYFCTRGGKASSDTRYRSIGYRVSLLIGGEKYSIDIGLGDRMSAQTVSEREISHDGKKYVYSLRRIAISDLQEKLLLAAGKNRMEIEEDIIRTGYQLTYQFDSLLTIYVLGVDARSGAKVIRETRTGIEVDDSRGKVYTSKKSIADDIGLSENTFSNFYDRGVDIINPNPIQVTPIQVTGNDGGNLFSSSEGIFIRKNSQFQLEYQVSSAYASDTMQPNASNLKGRGIWEGDVQLFTSVNQTISKMTQTGRGWRDVVEEVVAKRPQKKNLEYHITMNMQAPDTAKEELTAQGLLLGESEILAGTDAWEEGKIRKLICDGKAPDITYANGKILIKDAGSGVMGYRIYKNSELVIEATTLPDQKNATVYIEQGGIYRITTWDRVNNRVDDYFLKTGADLSVEVSGTEGWNPEEIYFNANISSAAYITYAALYEEGRSDPIASWSFNRQKDSVRIGPVNTQRIETDYDGPRTWTIVVYGSEYMGAIVEDRKSFTVAIDQGVPQLVIPSEGWYQKGREGPSFSSVDINRKNSIGKRGVSGIRYLTIYDMVSGEVLGRCRGEENNPINEAATLSASITADTSRLLSIVSRDYAGKIRQVDSTLMVDDTPPLVRVTNVASLAQIENWRNQDLTLQYEVSEKESGLQSVWLDVCNLQGSVQLWKRRYFSENPKEQHYPYPTRSSSFTGEVTFSEEGSYQYRMVGLDQAENRSKKELTVSIDRQKPKAMIGDLAEWNPKRLDITIDDHNAKANAVSGIGEVRLWYIDKAGIEYLVDKKDGGGHVNETITFDFKNKENYQNAKVVFCEGVQQYRIDASDRAGNVTQINFKMKWDFTSPNVNWYPSGDRDGYNPVVLDCLANDKQSGLHTIRYYDVSREQELQNRTFTLSPSTQNHHIQLFPVQYKTNKISYVAEDNAGNRTSGFIPIEWIASKLAATLYASSNGKEAPGPFLAGQKLILTMHTEGFMERLQVEYDSHLCMQDSEVFQVWEDTLKGEREEERMLEIQLPDSIQDGTYSLLVTGRRGYETKKVRISFEVRGTIYQEIRTRIR